MLTIVDTMLMLFLGLSFSLYKSIPYCPTNTRVSVTSAGDVTLAGDLILASTAGETSTLSVADTTGVLTITTAGDGTTDSDLILDVDGRIVLDAANGKFSTKNAGTEFSVASSAYAGMILGYRCLGHDEGRVAFAIPDVGTGFETLHADATVRIIAPPSGVIEIYVQAGYLDASSGRAIYFGLSDNATYNTIGAEHENIVNITDETDQQIIQNTWVISGLTAGDTYNYWFGLRSSHTGSILNYGGTGTGHYSPFIMKITALPASTTNFAEYD